MILLRLLPVFLVLLWFQTARAAPVPPNGIPAPVSQIDEAARKVFDQSVQAYEQNQSLEINFSYQPGGLSYQPNGSDQTMRLRIRRPGDVHLQVQNGATATLYTDDHQWRRNQTNFYWRTNYRFWKSNLWFASQVANLWLLPLLTGKNPLALEPSAFMIGEQKWSELTLLAPQSVRGQNCIGVRRRSWFYRPAEDGQREVWKFFDHKVWLRADDFLLWEVGGEAKTYRDQELRAEPIRFQVTDIKINSPLSDDAFVYRLAPESVDATLDLKTPFWDKNLKNGALPPILDEDFRHQTVNLAAFVGRPVVMWFGFPTENGDLPAARQLAQNWAPHGVQIVAVQMDSAPQEPAFSFPVVMAYNAFSNPTTEKFGLQKAPFVLVLARDGTIAALNPSEAELEPLLFQLLQAPDPKSPATKDATTKELAANLINDAKRRETLELWENRALPRAFSAPETANLVTLLPKLEPLEAGAVSRILARSHESETSRVNAIVARFLQTVQGPIPDDDASFPRQLSPRAFVLSGFLPAFESFDPAERALALQKLQQPNIEPLAPFVVQETATWSAIARAFLGDAKVAPILEASLERENDLSNAIFLVRALAKTGDEAALRRFGQTLQTSENRYGDSWNRFNDLRQTVQQELKNLETKGKLP